MGLRLAALLPVDPRDAEPAPLLAAAHLLPRLLRHPVCVTSRPVAQRAPGRVAAHDLRRDGDVLPLLCLLPLFPGRRPPVCLRPRPQCGYRSVARAGHAVAARSRRLLGRGVSILARGGGCCGLRVRAALLATARPPPRAADIRAPAVRAVRSVPLCGCCGRRASCCTARCGLPANS